MLYDLERQFIFAKANREHLRCFFIWLKIRKLKRKERRLR